MCLNHLWIFWSINKTNCLINFIITINWIKAVWQTKRNEYYTKAILKIYYWFLESMGEWGFLILNKITKNSFLIVWIIKIWRNKFKIHISIKRQQCNNLKMLLDSPLNISMIKSFQNNRNLISNLIFNDLYLYIIFIYRV